MGFSTISLEKLFVIGCFDIQVVTAWLSHFRSIKSQENSAAILYSRLSSKETNETEKPCAIVTLSTSLAVPYRGPGRAGRRSARGVSFLSLEGQVRSIAGRYEVRHACAGQEGVEVTGRVGGEVVLVAKALAVDKDGAGQPQALFVIVFVHLFRLFRPLQHLRLGEARKAGPRVLVRFALAPARRVALWLISARERSTEEGSNEPEREKGSQKAFTATIIPIRIPSVLGPLLFFQILRNFIYRLPRERHGPLWATLI